MNVRILLAMAAALAMAGCATTGMEPAGSPKEMKLAFDVTEGNLTALISKLSTIELTRKQLSEAGVAPKFVVAFRGPASYYTQTNLSLIKEADRADALKVRSIIRELKAAKGVESIEQCNVPVTIFKLNPKDLMEEVKMVPNGWITLGQYQQQGYGYIAP